MNAINTCWSLHRVINFIGNTVFSCSNSLEDVRSEHVHEPETYLRIKPERKNKRQRPQSCKRHEPTLKKIKNRAMEMSKNLNSRRRLENQGFVSNGSINTGKCFHLLNY